MSVHIVDYKQRTNAEGEPFFSLILEGDVEMVQSQETGRYYATARRASITSTFGEETCKRLIGKEMPGTITKHECPPYEYELPETGEVITLSHSYDYSPDEKDSSTEEAIFERRKLRRQAMKA